MSVELDQARQAVQNARAALRDGDRSAARRWAEQAARLAPQLEEPWLVLATVASPRASIKYIEQALQLNPESPRAKRAMRWALTRIQGATATQEAHARRGNTGSQKGSAGPKQARRFAVLPLLLLTLGCLVVVFAAWTARMTPVLASILSEPSRPTEVVHPPVWARVSIAKPTYTPGPAPVLAQESAPIASPLPTMAPPTPLPTLAPLTDVTTSEPATEPAPTLPEPPTATPESVDPEGVLSMEVLEDTPTPQAPPTSAYVQATTAPQGPAPVGDGVRWIDINLSEQRLYAYQGNAMANAFVVSTGTWAHPTVTGTFHIWNKTRIQDMSGPGYYLPDVPYVMYFYKDYGMHGTYWHNNFGTPMSHGCVNLTIPDSEWLYNWAYVGLTVKVHY